MYEYDPWRSEDFSAIGRYFFWKFVYANGIFFCTWNAIIRGYIGYVKRHIYTNTLLPPFKKFFYCNQRGGDIFPPPTVGNFFLEFMYENGIFLHIKCHY